MHWHEEITEHKRNRESCIQECAPVQANREETLNNNKQITIYYIIGAEV